MSCGRGLGGEAVGFCFGGLYGEVVLVCLGLWDVLWEEILFSSMVCI